MCLAGRPNGVMATIIHNHPSLNNIPHDGFCDYMFFDMMRKASAYNFEYMQELEYEPIIEMESSYKNIMPLSPLFEVNVDDGVLLACSFDFECLKPMVENGCITTVGTIEFDMPDNDKAKALILEITMKSDKRILSNDWLFYCNPDDGIKGNIIDDDKIFTAVLIIQHH